MPIIKNLANGLLEIQPVIPYGENQSYTLSIPANALKMKKVLAMIHMS